MGFAVTSVIDCVNNSETVQNLSLLDVAKVLAHVAGGVHKFFIDLSFAIHTHAVQSCSTLCRHPCSHFQSCKNVEYSRGR